MQSNIKREIEKTSRMDLLRDDGECICTKLALLSIECLRQIKTPEEWSTTFLLLLSKKGAPSDTNNQRPTYLPSAMHKFFIKIISKYARRLVINEPREREVSKWLLYRE